MSKHHPRNDIGPDKEEEMRAMYMTGMSLAAVGEMFSVAESTVRYRFRRRGWRVRVSNQEKSRAKESVKFNGRRYTPDKDGYWRCHTKRFGKIIHRTLHRDVWEEHNGPIPEGCNIHHVDGDKANNHISNLRCIEAGQHSRNHMRNVTRRNCPRCDFHMWHDGSEHEDYFWFLSFDPGLPR